MSRSKNGGKVRILHCDPTSCEMEVEGHQATQAARELTQLIRGNTTVPRIVADHGDRVRLRIPNKREVKQRFQRAIQASA